ncbi:hypothetical protein Plhal304r1_c014g0054141 [Plasmopara halstedii]
MSAKLIVSLVFWGFDLFFVRLRSLISFVAGPDKAFKPASLDKTFGVWKYHHTFQRLRTLVPFRGKIATAFIWHTLVIVIQL